MDESVKSVSGMLAKMCLANRQGEEKPYNSDNPANNIEWGFVVIDYEKVWLANREIWNKNQIMCLPRDFMKEEMQEKDTKVTEVYSDREKEIVFQFSLEENEGETLEEIRQARMERDQSLEYDDVEQYIWNGEIILTYSFCSDDESGSFYHMFFLKELDGRTGVGEFTCRVEYRKEWELVLKQMCLTIQPPHKGEEE